MLITAPCPITQWLFSNWLFALVLIKQSTYLFIEIRVNTLRLTVVSILEITISATSSSSVKLLKFRK